MPTPVADPELDVILSQCATSIEAHCRVFHPERFSRPFSAGHKEFFRVVDSSDRPQRVVVICHRGWGKTSLAGVGVPSQAIIFEKSHFITKCSATADLAVLHSEMLKKELKGNRAVLAVTGPIESDNFSKEMWVTSNNVMVLPRGKDQQIRGLGHEIWRPDLHMVDDLEDSKYIDSPDYRDGCTDWLYADVLGSVDQEKHNYRLYCLGTILHEDAMMVRLSKDPNWTVLNYPLCDENFESYWPEFMTTEKIKQLRDMYMSQGKLGVFHREYMNDPIPKENAAFRQDCFRYYDEGAENLNQLAENVVILDPAKSLSVHSDYSAIVGVGLQPSRRRIYVRDIVNRRMRPDEIYRELFDMAQRLNAQTIGVEVTSLNEFIMQPLRDYMFAHGYHYNIVELKARKGEGERLSASQKGKARIAALAPYYRMGWILHNASVCGPLEAQLLPFPLSAHDDIADALAYVLELMATGNRLFEEPLGAGYELQTKEDSFEKAYAELEEFSLPPLSSYLPSKRRALA